MKNRNSKLKTQDLTFDYSKSNYRIRVYDKSTSKQKSPSDQGALYALLLGKKKAPSETFLKTLRYHSMQNLVLSRVCA